MSRSGVSIGSVEEVQGRYVYVGYGVGPRSHRGPIWTCWADSCNAVLACSGCIRHDTAGALATVSRARAWSCCLMQFLLVPQKQIPACEAACAFWTLKGLLFRVASFVSF